MISANSVDSILHSILARCVPAAAVPCPDAAADRDGFLAAFAMAGRKLRRSTPSLTPVEAEILNHAGLATPQSLTAADIARTRMLLAALAVLPEQDHAPLVHELYRAGDNAEREAVLKVLALLPAPHRFLDTAIDAVRAVVQTTVEAIACGNSYPAAFFPPAAFRALVLKALHMGLPLARIHGLEQRRDGELARMADDYASERRAAGRPVSADIGLLTRKPAPCG